MYVQDAENAPHKKKKDSSTSHAEKRSDHEHWYVADLMTYNYCDGDSFTFRRAVCIFCERRPRMTMAKREKLEIYRTFSYRVHRVSCDHKREECSFAPPYNPILAQPCLLRILNT